MKAFNSHMVCYIVMNVTLTLGVLRSVVGPTILHKIRLKNELEKSFMVIADFIQFTSAIDKFLSLQGRLGTSLRVHTIL